MRPDRLAALYRRQAELALEIAAAYEEQATGCATLIYSSEALPPDCPTRRAFAEWCRQRRPAGAKREGRLWSCPRDAWQASRLRRVVHRDVKPENVDDDLAERALQQSVFRPTRKSA